MEDLPSRQDWKKVWWPMPQPEITPRPVRTTRFLVDSALSCVVVEWRRTFLVDGCGRRVKEVTVVQIRKKEDMVGDANLMIDFLFIF